MLRAMKPRPKRHSAAKAITITTLTTVRRTNSGHRRLEALIGAVDAPHVHPIVWIAAGLIRVPDAAHHRGQLAEQLLDAWRIALHHAEDRGGAIEVMVRVIHHRRALRHGAVQLLGRATAQRLVENAHHPVLLDERALQVLLPRRE